MEQEESQVNSPEARVELDEAAWIAHVTAAQKFPGTEKEYCRDHELGFSQFRKRKRKLGMSAARGRPKKAFVRVETLQGPTPEKEPTKPGRPREFRGLPDPRWMAEFVTALVDAQ